MEMLLIVSLMFAFSIILVWIIKNQEKQEYNRKNMYELKRIDDETTSIIWYWKDERSFKRKTGKKILNSEKVIQIRGVYRRDIYGWQCEFIMKGGKVQKGFMVSSELTPKRLK